MSKRILKAYWIIFIVIFIAPSIIYTLFAECWDQTNYEQRSTAEKPVFSIKTIESFLDSYEKYFNDTLAFRTQMIEANGLIDFYLFKESPVEKVAVGNNGWLFYNPKGNDGDPIADMNASNSFSEEQLLQIANNLLEARDLLQDQGKELIVFIAPNKECIYGKDHLPAHLVTTSSHTRGDQVAEYLWENTDLKVVYPKKEIFNAMKNNPNHLFYYQTDTHWNELGAYIGAKSLLESIGIFIPDISDTTIDIKEKHAGDLTTMMGLSKYLDYDSKYEVSGYTEAKDIQSSYLVEGDSNNLISYSATDTNPRSMFVIRDSFSMAMMPYLSTQFNECHFVHRSCFTPELLSQYSPDIVVVQVVERAADYLSWVSLK